MKKGIDVTRFLGSEIQIAGQYAVTLLSVPDRLPCHFPLRAVEITSSAAFAYVTDFGSGKVLMEKSPDASDETGINGKDHDGLYRVSSALPMAACRWMTPS